MSTAAAINLESHVDSRLHPRRYEGINRSYAKVDVERLRGSLQIEHTLATTGAMRL